ncbi:hypothetical protein AKJ47_01035 [candidate division MSBL1 archaeon SCGC-AAA261G05]|uniref:GTP-dependent dephospho-CoA kinase n=2 Tax=candidate division MSBL1 TaxID=215777 RepID=A0A133V2A3_9EURY|nr:hypothetical protein AKJ42_00325 [candidate division MSBL1 archaeon SCGC-AAA261C02]KXB04018.1 hypothetical protein AKJ47_01035 [candidate division MSBL1 archaeon SCGC-AAA261G05]
MKLPEEARQYLKEPLGKLFESTQSGIDYSKKSEFKRLVTVGDVVTAEFLRAGIEPDVAVVDYSIMRASADEDTKKAIENFSASSVRVKNPAGQITEELEEALKAVTPPLKIIIEGEEDLATLPAVLSAPLGSAVIYGQPDQGMVIVEVTEEKKREFEELLELFERE